MPDEDTNEPRKARPIGKPVSRRRDDDDDFDDDDEDDRPRRRRRDDDERDGTGGLIPYKNPKALLSYYIGIFGFFLPLIGSAIAIYLGIQGLKYAKEHPKSSGQAHAIIGIICGTLGSLFYLGIIGIIIVGVLANRK